MKRNSIYLVFLLFLLTTSVVACGNVSDSTSTQKPDEQLEQEHIEEEEPVDINQEEQKVDNQEKNERTLLQDFFINVNEKCTAEEAVSYAESMGLGAKIDTYGSVKVADSKNINFAGVGGNKSEYIHMVFSADNKSLENMVYYPSHNHGFPVKFYRFGKWDDVSNDSIENEYFGCYLSYALYEDGDNDVIEINKTDTYRKTTISNKYIRVDSRETAMLRISPYNTKW